MRFSLLSLLLLSAATPALADPATEAAAPVAEQPRAPERRAAEPRRADPPFRRGEDRAAPRRAERVPLAEPRFEAAERPPQSPVQQPVLRSQPRSGGGDAGSRQRNARVEETLSRSEAEAAPQASVTNRDAVRSIAGAGIRPSRGGEEWSRPTLGATNSARPDAATQDRRGGNRGRSAGVRNVPPTASSPFGGSANSTPDTVVRSVSETSPASVAGAGLRDRIAAEELRRNRAEQGSWRRDWRQDRRYDWRRHRDRDRSRFHLGIYIDPFGWRRRDYDIGWQLPARYYASRYWIVDPWYYRLPPVAGPYRWIRYHHDVLLVDLRSGRVLDRIPNFFW